MGRPQHPLGGLSGEGPPIAPTNWKWRAGKRPQDMYFFSPSGTRVRSRSELAKYLKTLTDPPLPEQFVWRCNGGLSSQGFGESALVNTGSNDALITALEDGRAEDGEKEPRKVSSRPKQMAHRAVRVNYTPRPKRDRKPISKFNPVS